MREKLIELINPVLRSLPWGEITVHTAEDIADRLIENSVTFEEDNNVPIKWIPVTERLPEDTEMVLVYSEIGNQYVAQHFRGHFYSDGTRIRTSHWMPLPKPPKGE